MRVSWAAEHCLSLMRNVCVRRTAERAGARAQSTTFMLGIILAV